MVSIKTSIKEADLKQHFGTKVSAPYTPIDRDVLDKCVSGLDKRIVNERYPERKKKLKAIRLEIKALLKELSD